MNKIWILVAIILLFVLAVSVWFYIGKVGNWANILGDKSKDIVNDGFGNMKISSPVFENEETIPSEFTCEGADLSPPLKFTNLPNNTKSLVLIVDDPDANNWVHWLVWNIPPNSTGFSKGENIAFPQGKNDFDDQRYNGPCPPSGTHRYFFRLYALGTMLDLKSGATRAQLDAAMSGHIIENTQLIGTCSK
jgi:Raf kinase inhibitor-like YbhB/YbcL family protein